MTRLDFRRRALLIAATAFIVVFILWNVPRLSAVSYPFRLFVTFVHEAGHGLAAIISGGRLDGFVISPDGTGYARTSGGSLALILPAGYLGAALFGAILFYFSNTIRQTRLIAVTLGVCLVIIALLFTGIISTAGIVGGVSGLLLIYLGWRGSEMLTLLTLNLTAVMTGLHAVLDLVFLISNSSAQLGDIRNDAAAFSANVVPLVPGVVWALLWAGLAVGMLGLALYYGVIRRLVRP
jgi:hypothetical protein